MRAAKGRGGRCGLRVGWVLGVAGCVAGAFCGAGRAGAQVERDAAGVFSTRTAASAGQGRPRWMPYGGVHEVGVWSGASWFSGPI
jgi:hypothetical protein